MEGEENQLKIICDVQLVADAVDVPPKVLFVEANLGFDFGAGATSQEEAKHLLFKESQARVPAF